MTRTRRVRPRGFSMVELVIVMTITVTLAAIAAPRYGGAIARYRVQLAAERVAEDLRRAMSAAGAAAPR